MKVLIQESNSLMMYTVSCETKKRSSTTFFNNTTDMSHKPRMHSL